MNAQTFGRDLTRLVVLWSVALAVMGLAGAIFGAGYSIYFRTPFPFRDMVETMEFLDGNPELWLGDSFTRLHDMEHRPALPAFIWYVDRIVSGSSGLMPLLVSHLALSVTALLAVWNWMPRLSLGVPATWLAPTAALGMMFSLTNWHNLVWEKQLHVAMSLLFLTVAAHCAARLAPAMDEFHRRGSRRSLLFAVLAAWAAKFSFGYGLTAMPVITIHGMLARWPWREVAISAGFSAIFLATYYYFFSLGGRSPEGFNNAPFGSVVMIAYIARLLAGAVAVTGFHLFIEIDHSEAALVVGLGLLGLYLFGTARLYWRSVGLRTPPSPFQSVSLIVTSACVAIALMTWLSRPEDTQGLVSRYYIVSTLFTLSLPGLFISSRDWGRLGITARVRVFGLSSTFVALSLWGHFAHFAAPPLRWHAAAVAAIGADMGIYLPESHALIGPPLHQGEDKTFDVWSAHRQRLKARQEYEPFAWRGQKLSIVFGHSEGERCAGEVHSTKAVPGTESGFVFTGWARHGENGAVNADWVVTADATGRIVGLGAPGRRLVNGRAWLEDQVPQEMGAFANHAGVAGYIEAPPNTVVRFYSVKGGKACQFAISIVAD